MSRGAASSSAVAGVPRRVFGVGLLLVGVGVGAYLLFGASDQRRILSSLRELCASASSLPGETDAARGRRFRAALARLALPSVTLSIPELGTFEGQDEIAAAFEQADGLGLSFSIEQSDVHVKESRAEATLRMSIVVKVPSEERRQIRTVSAELTRRGETFLISSLSVGLRADDPPEARP
jgi:hypothetical protein